MAAQVAHFRSESTSPIAPISSKPRHQNSMASAGPSSKNVATNLNAGQSNNFEGITALMLACQQGQSEDVQKILRKKNTTVKERTRSGKVALHFCAESGNIQCFEQILAAEPFLINAQDEEGYTPIHLSVINGNKDIVRKLIASGADLACLDNERHSLVHWATVCGEVDILEILLSNGAPASTPDIHLAHPIHYAAQLCGSVNGVAVSRARVQSTVYGVSPKKGLQILKRLVQFGCPIDVKDKDGRQPILWASSAGSGDAILLLVNAGAKVDADADKDGLTALHCAASRGHTDCLETLIALCGAEVDVIDNNGCTALFYAVTLGHADCTELILNYGSEPNRQDRKGRTPAHCGAAKGQLETLKLLVKHGGNLWLRNVRGDLPLHEAVLSRRKDLVMWLLSLRPDAVNTSNNDGRCPIHLAALNNNVEMVKILIDHRAEVNVLMRSGKGTAMTPLDAAIHRGNSAVAKFLQLHGGLPSNSLNDAALHRRLNRSSVEGQISPASSMRGSNLGSHHHPSPEDQQMNFTSPEVFDNSLIHYSRNSQNQNAYDKRGPQAISPFIATSTPIMDDGVQTDPHYFRDMEVQTMQEYIEKGDEKQESKQRDNSHRKSDRRRRRRSHQDDRDSSSESSADRSSNQLASRASRKSSRKSGKNSSKSGSKSHSHSSSRNSEEKTKELLKENSIEKDDETDSTSHSRDKKKTLTPQCSSDTLLDNTLTSEKFSELENAAVQSSETDAREEELGPPDKIEESIEKKQKVEPSIKNKSKKKEKSVKSDKESEEEVKRQSESDDIKSKMTKNKSKSTDDDEKQNESNGKSPDATKTESKLISKQKSSDSSPERTSKSKKSSETRDRSKTKSKSRESTPKEASKKSRESTPKEVSKKSKSRDSTPERTTNESRDPTPEKNSKRSTSSKERSLSAKSAKKESANEKKDKPPRSRSASASESRSVSRNKSNEISTSRHEDSSQKNESKDTDNRNTSARKSRSRSPSQKHQRKNSNLKSRTPSGKTGSVSWHDDENRKSQAKVSSDEDKEIPSSPKSESTEKVANSKPSKSRSSSSESKKQSEDKSDPESKSHSNDIELNDKGRRSRSSSGKKYEKSEKTDAPVVRKRARSMEFREKDTGHSHSEDEDEEEREIPDEIEAGKAINLREAARRRSESVARDPSRSRSQSVSKSRPTTIDATLGSSSQQKKKSGVGKLKPVRNRKAVSKSEEREIQLQEALLASRKKLRSSKNSAISKSKGQLSAIQKSGAIKNLPSKIPTARRSSGENDLMSQSTVPDSGFSDPLGLTTSASEDHNNKLYSQGKSHVSMKRKVVTRRPGSGSARRNTIFSSLPKQYRAPRVERKRFDTDTLIVRQLSVEHGGHDGDDTNSTSTRGGSVTSEETVEDITRRRRPNLSRPRSRLTFSRGDDVRDSRLSPRPRKNMDVETPISVTQAMQASMRKYNLERTVFQELLELKRLQIRAGKANEQMLVKRLAENYRKAGYSVNFRDYDGPFTFRGFEKFLYDQLRVLQSNKRVLPRFAPSDDLEKLSMALKKMNATKLPFLETERSESTTCDSQCAHSTHRCHHAAHNYTGVPCAAYIGNRKNGFLPKVNPIKAPGPTQKDAGTKNMIANGSRNAMNLSSPMQISISPRTDTQSPITLEVQQGANTQVFTLPTKALDPSKNYYVSLSIKPNPTSPGSSPAPPAFKSMDNRPSPAGDIVDDGSISAPPPPAENDSDVQLDLDREKHNRSN